MSLRTPLVALLLLLVPAAGSGEAPAAFTAGMEALLEGNYAEAYCRWKPLAERGHAESQYNLGWLYANGNGLKVDMQQAIRWWEAAATQGHADAAFALGLDYITGEGVERDLDKAAHWLYQAAAAGHADAREVLLRLAGETGSDDLLRRLPHLMDEPWFGWPAEVVGNRINVRAGPGTSHKIVGKLHRGQRIRVVGQRGNWLRVRLPAVEESGHAVIAWVYHSLLKRVSRETIEPES